MKNIEDFLFSTKSINKFTQNSVEPFYNRSKKEQICEKLCEERWVMESNYVPENYQLHDYFYRTKLDKLSLISELDMENSTANLS